MDCVGGCAQCDGQIFLTREKRKPAPHVRRVYRGVTEVVQ